MKKIDFKKCLSLLLLVVMVMSITACGGGGEGGDAEGGSSGDTEFLVMGTGGVAGTWYPVGGVICAAISKAPNLNATAQTAAGGVESIRLVSKNERQMGFAMPSLAVYAEEGIEAFDGEPIDNIRALCTFMPMEAHFVVRADSNINSLEDLKGKAIGTGPPGSGDEVMCREVLDAVGITYDDIKPMMLSFAEQVTAFKDRQLDAMFMLASSPTSSVMDASSQADVKLLPIEGDLRDQILEKYPYYTEATISKDKYTFMTEDSNTIGIPTMLFTNAEMSDDVAYGVLEYMFKDLEAIQAAHPSMENFNLDTAIEGLTVTLHPGAEKFYKENGVL